MIKPNEEPTFEFDSYNQNYVANNGQPQDHVVANLSVNNSSVENYDTKYEVHQENVVFGLNVSKLSNENYDTNYEPHEFT
jgi:hypothetical protein